MVVTAHSVRVDTVRTLPPTGGKRSGPWSDAEGPLVRVVGARVTRTIELVTGRVDPSPPAVASVADARDPALAGSMAASSMAAGRSASERIAARLRRPPRPSPARRFLLANLIILVIGGLLIGVWVGDLLERGIVDRTASITALYVESFIEPEVDSLATTGTLPADQVRQLDSLLAQTSLGDRIVSLRIWSPEGVVAYSPDPSLMGRSFPVEGGLAEALTGRVVAELSDLQSSENVLERGRFDRLLEMYVPVRQRGSDRIIAVAEFYQQPEALDREVGNARLETWVLVGIAVLVSYLVLHGIVRQASVTIDRQQTALRQQVGELSTLLAQNAALHQRVSAAADRTTTLNERALRRIGADLHDGPAQMLSLALLRLDAGSACGGGWLAGGPGGGRRSPAGRAAGDARHRQRPAAAGAGVPDRGGGRSAGHRRPSPTDGCGRGRRCRRHPDDRAAVGAYRALSGAPGADVECHPAWHRDYHRWPARRGIHAASRRGG